jgi:hypothetical protein
MVGVQREVTNARARHHGNSIEVLIEWGLSGVGRFTVSTPLALPCNHELANKITSTVIRISCFKTIPLFFKDILSHPR